MRNYRLSSVCFLIVYAFAVQAKSADPVLIAEGTAPNHPQQPQVAMDAAGTVHLAYGANNDTFYCQSADGRAFSKPIKLPSVNVLSLGMRRGPRIAVTEDSICVTVIGGKNGKGRDGDVLALRSSDQGKTWEEPVVVNDVPDAAREGLHAIASSSKGQIACVWLDLRNKGTEIRAASSSDGGKTWGDNHLVYRSPGGSVCECCHPSATYDNQGRLIVMWRNAVHGNRDMYASASSDGGKRFSDAFKIGEASWKLDHCPMDGGAISARGKDNLVSAWRREDRVYVARSGQREESLGSGEQPWIAATGKGFAAVWLTRRGGDLMLKLSGSKTTSLASGAADPIIAANDTHLVVAWEGQQQGRRRIYCQVWKQ